MMPGKYFLVLFFVALFFLSFFKKEDLIAGNNQNPYSPETTQQ